MSVKSMGTGYTSAWRIKSPGDSSELNLRDVNDEISKIHRAGGIVESVEREWDSSGNLRIIVSYALPKDESA